MVVADEGACVLCAVFVLFVCARACAEVEVVLICAVI